MSEKKKNYDKKTGEELPERFTISTELLNHALGFLSILPVFQAMELITRINMDITPVGPVAASKEEAKEETV